jgi:hypothetical protein
MELSAMLQMGLEIIMVRRGFMAVETTYYMYST